MSLVALFGKLQEHEIGLSHLEESEEIDKKKKNIASKLKYMNQQGIKIEMMMNMKT